MDPMEKTIINFNPTGMSMELSKYLVSWVVAYLGDLQPAYIYIYQMDPMENRWILWKKPYPGSPTTIFKSGWELRVSPWF